MPNRAWGDDTADLDRPSDDQSHMRAMLSRMEAELTKLRGDRAKLFFALVAAKDKLALYRSQHSGEYVGGLEYSVLERQINEALGLKD